MPEPLEHFVNFHSVPVRKNSGSTARSSSALSFTVNNTATENTRGLSRERKFSFLQNGIVQYFLDSIKIS